MDSNHQHSDLESDALPVGATDAYDFESTLFFASLWYSPRLVKPDRAFLYQKSHMSNQLISHHVGHIIRWWAEPFRRGGTLLIYNR